MANVFAIASLLIAILNSSLLPGIRLIYYSSPDSPPVELQNIVLSQVQFNTSKQLKIMCHGWRASSNVDWYDPLLRAYLGKGHAVIAIDWSIYAYNGYAVALFSTPAVGQVIAHYLTQLSNIFTQFNFDQVHIIGHSLGAHVAGFTGKRILNDESHMKVGRITGLDPAAPGFSIVPAAGRLDAADANFVDVIHTATAGIGIAKAIGTVDFFPDGGFFQYSCGIYGLACSHNIAAHYLIASVDSDVFVGTQCGSYFQYLLGQCANNPVAIMGEGCDRNVSGMYFLFSV